jgi:hypothetical protein
MAERYSGYDVLDKWRSPSFDGQTREIVARRLKFIPSRRFFTVHEWSLLEAIEARLVPQPDRAHPISVTPWIDDYLAEQRSEGFRHDSMPSISVAWRMGLAAIDSEAIGRFSKGFIQLDPQSQDGTLGAVQRGEIDRAVWAGLPAERFFSDVLLKTVAGLYYAHPTAWSEIGFGGPASPRGYVRLGFDERDPWEAKEIR